MKFEKIISECEEHDKAKAIWKFVNNKTDVSDDEKMMVLSAIWEFVNNKKT